MACSKVKDIHDIDDFAEMYELMKSLGVPTKKLKGINDMKSRVKKFMEEAKSRGSWSAAEFSSTVLKVKEDYVRKSKMLLKSYTEAERILTAACKEFPSLKADIGNYEKHVKEQKQSEFFLLVTGQTSAGKSLLINLLLGEEILPSSHTRVTSTICEIKYGEQRRIRAHRKSGDPKTTGTTMEISLEPPSEPSDKSYSDQISPFVDGEASLYSKVELFWPHPLLQNGIVIVDSPGVGETEEFDTMVYQYIPEVFAFIYVISLANSDGIQKDTLGKLFKVVKNTYSLQKQKTEENLATASPFEEYTRESEMSHDLQECLLSKCALFVSNKLDILEEKDVQNVEEVVVKKLTKIWPGVDPKSQVIFMSAKNATSAQKYGVVAESFSSLVRKLKGVITQGIDYRLDIKWRWLNDVLSRTIAKAESSRKTTCQSQEEVQKIVHSHIRMIGLRYVKEHKDEIMEELRAHLETYQQDAVTRAHEYLSSEEVIENFTMWTEDNIPQKGDNWSKTEENIQRALSNRFKETLQHWLEDCMLLARAQESLQNILMRYFPSGEDHLRGLSGGLEEGSIPSFRQPNLGFGGVTLEGAVFAAGVAFFMRHAASSILRLAIPTSLVVVGLSMDVFYFLRQRWDSQEFGKDTKAFMSRQSRNYLAQMAGRNKVSECVKLLLKPVEHYLDEIGSTFPTLIAAEMEELRQLENEKRSLEEVKDAYAKIHEEGCRQRGRHAVLGLTEMCSIQISGEALDWKGDISSRLGSGTFGDVYTGKMRQDGDTKNVALKVSKKKLNEKNASELMGEIENLRTLSGHRHIVQFYGISLPGNFLALVFEKCKGSLADFIFEDEKEKKPVPDTSKNPPFGIQTKFQWAREITDGLAFIHANEVVHRDLKPENILVSEENSIKIADVGLAKPAEIITGTVAGTYAYMAPEVFDSKRYNEKVDIYSLAIILWEIWYGKRGYQWPGNVAEFFGWLKDGNRPVNKKSCNEPPWNHLMKQCWSGNPENRPTAKECKSEIERVCSLK